MGEAAFKIVKGLHACPSKADAEESRLQRMHVPSGRQQDTFFFQQTIVEPVLCLPRGFIKEAPKISPDEKATHWEHARCAHALQSTRNLVVGRLQQPAVFFFETIQKFFVFQHLCHSMLQITWDCMKVPQSTQHVVEIHVAGVDEAHPHSTGSKIFAEAHDGMHSFIARLCQIGTLLHEGFHSIGGRAHVLHQTIVHRAQVDFIRNHVHISSHRPLDGLFHAFQFHCISTRIVGLRQQQHSGPLPVLFDLSGRFFQRFRSISSCRHRLHLGSGGQIGIEGRVVRCWYDGHVSWIAQRKGQHFHCRSTTVACRHHGRVGSRCFGEQATSRRLSQAQASTHVSITQ
eukprot:scaffold1771_cov343-Pavlova_lutheri.AAC.19